MLKNFFKNVKSKSDKKYNLNPNSIPNHVAIIMDGNGRWAKQRNLPRVAGHKKGMNVVKDITIKASKLGIKVLTLYAFSTENWNRPASEVNYIMSLPIKFFDTFVPDLKKNNIKVNVMGYLDHLPYKTQNAVNEAINQTKYNDGMILNFALNYGGRADIISGVKKIFNLAKNNSIDIDDLNEEYFSHFLMTENIAPYNDPELLIRTSGEKRISNFLLWQLAYSELVFNNKYWPDYSSTDLIKDIYEYQHRNRRFGNIKED